MGRTNKNGGDEKIESGKPNFSEIIIVLGGGINEKRILPHWVNKRLEKAIYLIRKGISERILLSGKGRDEFPITEAKAMKDYLLNAGISENKILVEELSVDTIQNAYFSKVIHLDPLKIESAIIITNNFHSERTKLIFDHVISDKVKCYYDLIDDEGIEEKRLKMREFTEKELIKFYAYLFNNIQKYSLEEIHDFIFNSSNKYYKSYMELGEKLKSKMVLY